MNNAGENHSAAAPVFAREYEKLTGASDKYFGAVGMFTLGLAVLAWARGDVSVRSVAWIAGLIAVNLGYSQLVMRARESRRVRLEISRVLTNLVLCPVVYYQVETPLAPWWPLYVLFTLASVMVVAFSFSSRIPARILVLAWALNFSLAAGWLQPLMGGYQLAYVVATILMTGLVTVDWINTSKMSIDREVERTLELREANRQLAEEKARIIELYGQLDAERAKTAHNAKLAALGEMAGGVAHEINTPLAIIRLNAEQLQDVLADEVVDREMTVALTGTIKKTVDRIATIVKGLTSFSRDADGDPFTLAAVLEVVEETLSFCREKFRDQAIEIELGDIPRSALISCRPAQISQVLLNLLNNSFDAIAKGSAPKWVRIELRSDTDAHRLVVTDSGRGLSPGAQAKLFQPFFTTKEIGKGTGLGLSISKGIIEAHGGTLTLDASAANTCFVVTLPLAV